MKKLIISLLILNLMVLGAAAQNPVFSPTSFTAEDRSPSLLM